MSRHTCTEIGVINCFRCDLSRDEAVAARTFDPEAFGAALKDWRETRPPARPLTRSQRNGLLQRINAGLGERPGSPYVSLYLGRRTVEALKITLERS